MLDNILPVGGVVVTTQVGLELSTQDLQGSTLANTVGSDQTKNLTGTRHRQAMQLEAVGAITVGDLALEVGGQVDDGNGVEGTLLGADTATDTERLGDEGKTGIRGDLNTELATTDDGARLFALLTAFSRTTLRASKVSAWWGDKARRKRRRHTLSSLTMAILKTLYQYSIANINRL